MKYQASIQLKNKNNSHTLAFDIISEYAAGRQLKVLEIGCSTGYFGSALISFGHSVWGIEPNPEAAAIASTVLDNVYVGSIEDFLHSNQGAAFDVIVFGDVLEHLLYPVETLKLTKTILTENGIVVASVPNIAHLAIRAMLLEGQWNYSDLGILDRTHLRFYTKATLVDLFSDSGYQIHRIDAVRLSAEEVNELCQMNLSPSSIANARGFALDDRGHDFQYIITSIPLSHSEEARLANKNLLIDDNLRVLCLVDDPFSSLVEIRLRNPLRRWAGLFGGSVRIEHISANLEDNLSWADIIIFHREGNEFTLELAALLKSKGKKIIFEIDDLLTEAPEFLSHHAPHLENTRPFTLALMAAADALSVSTETLGQRLLKYNSNLFVIPSYSEPLSLTACHSMVAESEVKLIVASSDKVLVDMLIDPLLVLQQEYGLRVISIGPPGERLANAGIDVECHKNIGHMEFKALIASINNGIGVIPLDESVFSSCKSAVKYLDYSICGVPSVCSNVRPYNSVIDHDVNGLLADNTSDSWIKELRRLILSHELRTRLVKSARSLVASQYNIDITAKAWQTLFNSLETSQIHDLDTYTKVPAPRWNSARKSLRNEVLMLETSRQKYIIKEQENELDHRLNLLQQTEQNRLEQIQRKEELEIELSEVKQRIGLIEENMNRMGLGRIRVKTPYFDSKYYLKANPDLVIHGVDPVVHYLFHGSFEGRYKTPPMTVFSLIMKGITEHGGVLRTAAKAINKLRRSGTGGVRSAIAKLRALEPANNPRGGYAEWIQTFDTIDQRQRETIKKSIQNFCHQPLISVVMPVYNSPPEFLERAIESVRVQLYPTWELCVADDASTDPAIRLILEKYVAQDKRIKVIYREENGHISAASNSALTLVTGEFIALLDHDDELSECALYHIAKRLSDHPDADLIYSDEDKINPSGRRYDPYFKPDFDPLLLLAQNMVSHLGVYRTALVRDIQGFRLGFEGSQDWDLALRIVEKTSRERIHHIPRVLYHWRALQGSTALSTSEKNYAVSAGQRAVADHLLRTGIKAVLVGAPDAPHLNRVIFDRTSINQKISIIIPTRDKADLLKNCVDSIRSKSKYKNYEIIVIDNGSIMDETFTLFESWSTETIRVIRDDSPFNFSRLNNQAVSYCTGELLCFLNNDIEIITPDWLEEMASFAIQPHIGCVGARLWYPSGELQHAGVILGVGGVANHAHYKVNKGDQGYFGRAVLHQEFSAVTAAALMLRRQAFDAVGGFDEELAVAFNDIDLCLRVRSAGYSNIWTPYAEMIHHESISRGSEDNMEKISRFNAEVKLMQNRWGMTLKNDPAYNPNLELERLDSSFSLAWPPRVSSL